MVFEEHNLKKRSIIWPKKEQCYWHNMLLLLAQSIKGWRERERRAKRGRGGKKGKRKGERACNHFFYDPLPPTFGTFEIIRFRL